MLCPAAAMQSTSVTPASFIQAAAFLRTVSVVTTAHGGPRITSLLVGNTAQSVGPAGLEEIA